MDKEQQTKGYLVSSIIGEGACFTGDIELKGLLRIDGDIIGTVRNDDRVLVGSFGRIQGQLYSDSIIVGGVVKGEIYAQSKVVILSSGVVIGNIYASKLVIEKGGLLDGKCIVSQSTDGKGKESITSGSFKLDWNKLGTEAGTYQAGRT